jgi:hypothetical protein
MIAPDTLANRHSLAVDGLSASTDSKVQSVRIVVDEGWGASRGGQLLVSCLVNLLCRQAGVVREIEIAAAKAPLLIALPFDAGDRDFPACLEQLSIWAVSNVVPVSTTNTSEPADIAIIVGGKKEPSRISTNGVEIFVVGDGWRAWVGDETAAPSNVASHSANPLGPFLAATLAAGEVFKRSRGIKRGRYLTCDGYSLWSGKASNNWQDLDDGPELVGRTLPPIHIVGAGAVGNGVAYVIANAALGDA